MPNDLMFIKRFPTWPHRAYGEIAALTISIWYFEDRMCELEPIGPLERIEPGQTASFTETWWLLRYPFPKRRNDVDLGGVQRIVREQTQ
jgi:hypothetical protein